MTHNKTEQEGNAVYLLLYGIIYYLQVCERYGGKDDKNVYDLAVMLTTGSLMIYTLWECLYRRRLPIRIMRACNSYNLKTQRRFIDLDIYELKYIHHSTSTQLCGLQSRDHSVSSRNSQRFATFPIRITVHSSADYYSSDRCAFFFLFPALSERCATTSN